LLIIGYTPVADEKKLHDNDKEANRTEPKAAENAPREDARTVIGSETEAKAVEPAPKVPAPDASPTIHDSIKTSMLSLEDALPMEQRDPRPNTAHLSLGWRIVFKIGDQKKTLPMKDMIMIGRAVESDSTANQINLDLTAYGAYHFGVSRNHAQMTLKDGYLYLEDLDSTNGTRINGFQLTANQKYRLRDGDEIEFARLRTVIQFKGPDTP
jgi:hypothetical protein